MNFVYNLKLKKNTTYCFHVQEGEAKKTRALKVRNFCVDQFA